MMSDIINLNDSYGNWENDFSEQNLIGIKEPDTECDILAKKNPTNTHFIPTDFYLCFYFWTSISNWSVIANVTV